MVIQLTELTAVHAQLEPVVIDTLPSSPVEAAETLVGEIEYVHCASAGCTSAMARPTTSNAAHTRAFIRCLKADWGATSRQSRWLHKADRSREL